MLGMAIGCAMAGDCRADEYAPEAWNLKARQQFAEQRFGIFIHWGLYANYAQGEWYLEQSKAQEADYARMMHAFYPSKFDARAWVKLFKRAGAKYVTITSRHHDGFSLWPTKADDGYNIANTPFKRDILGELALACREEGLQLNFYYSLMDWHRPDYPTGHCVNARRTLKNVKEDYASYKKFMMAQVTELIDNYHPGNIWFDGEWDHNADPNWDTPARPLDWEFDDIYDLIHAKRVLVANNNHQVMRPKEDIQLFERDMPGDSSDFGASKGIPVVRDRPLEQCDVIQPNIWGYRIAEQKFRPPEEIVAMVARAAARDSNLLMNIGPDASGLLPARTVEILEKVGAWFDRNGESIYGTRAGGVGLLKDVVSTRKGADVFYLHFLNPEVNKFAFKLNGEVASTECLMDGASATLERTPNGDAVVTVARPAGNGFDLVVKIRLK